MSERDDELERCRLSFEYFLEHYTNAPPLTAVQRHVLLHIKEGRRPYLRRGSVSAVLRSMLKDQAQ